MQHASGRLLKPSEGSRLTGLPRATLRTQFLRRKGFLQKAQLAGHISLFSFFWESAIIWKMLSVPIPYGRERGTHLGNLEVP